MAQRRGEPTAAAAQCAQCGRISAHWSTERDRADCAVPVGAEADRSAQWRNGDGNGASRSLWSAPAAAALDQPRLIALSSAIRCQLDG